MWWEFFHRCGFTEEEHVESRATLGALTYDGEVEQVKRSVIHRYRFPEQPHEIKVGDSPKNPDTAESDELKRGFCGTVVALDETAGTIDLKRARSSPVPHPAALVPLDNVQNTVLRESLARLAETAVSGGFAAASPRRSAFDLLGRVPPRIGAPASTPNTSGFAAPKDLVTLGETPLAAVRRVAPRLNRSVLPVQGPPGSGKTHTGARMILDLLADGKRVGVTANSHKVISNLLAAVCDAADGPSVENGRTGGESDGRPVRQAPVELRGIQKANAGDGCPDERIVQAGSNAEVAEALAAGDANLAGGTAWLWAREEIANAVDVLVIDEAGQMSLANTLAVCQAAGSLVLLGDPRQLDQPIQGVHPPGADVSALGHLLGESATVDPSRGVFLDHTWRMHPDICAFTTEQFYEGRLRARPELGRQTVVGPGPLAGYGLRFIPVAHAGNTNASAEEAECVAGLIRELLGTDAAWVDRQGVQSRLTLDDVLVVAPYNAHLAVLRATLPTGARVGTVDKFQGQEAPIVIYSMATSTADEAPRGMEFLYSLHRLNVATSRAPAAWPRSSPARPCSRRIAAPRSRCAWPTPSAASSNSPRPRPDTRAEVNISPVIRLKRAANSTTRAHSLTRASRGRTCDPADLPSASRLLLQIPRQARPAMPKPVAGSSLETLRRPISPNDVPVTSSLASGPPEVVVETDRALQRRRAVVDIASDPDPCASAVRGPGGLSDPPTGPRRTEHPGRPRGARRVCSWTFCC